VAACYDLATHALNKIGQHPASRLTADRAMAYARRRTTRWRWRCPPALWASSCATRAARRSRSGSPLDAIGAVEATGLSTLAARAVLTQTLCTAAYSAPPAATSTVR